MAKYTFVDGKIVFPDGEFFTREELMDQKEDVGVLTTGISVFEWGGKTFQSDGKTQTSVNPSVKTRLDQVLFKKAALVSSIGSKNGRGD